MSSASSWIVLAKFVRDLTKINDNQVRKEQPKTKSVQTPPRKLKSQSFVLLNSFPYRKPPYSKNLGGGTPPQGGFNPPPIWGRRVESFDPGLLRTFPHPSWTKFLTQRFSDLDSFLPPPKSSPLGSGRLHLLRRSAALARLGASWAEKIAFQEAFKN